jgi:phage/plasmid-associated DNA primase
MQGLLPLEGVSYVPPYAFAEKFQVTQLAGPVLNVCGELSEDRFIPGDTFKQVIEGASMQGQFKGQQIFNFRPKCAHWFASNHLPKTRDVSSGFFRRWLILSFTNIIPLAERVRNLGEKILTEEREKIMAWVVGAYPDLVSSNDYVLPPSHSYIVSEMTSENDTVFAWLSTGVKLTADFNTDEKALTMAYDSYKIYTYSIGAKAVGMRKFRHRLVEARG